MLLAVWATLTVSAATAGGILTPAFHLYFVIVFSAGLLLGWRAAVLFFLLVFLTGVAIYYAESNGLLPALLTEGQLIRTWIIFDMAAGLVAVLSGLALGDTYKALATARRELAERERAEQSLQTANLELAQAYDTTIEGWARMVELRDVETQDHSQRVAELATRLAEQMGITGEPLAHLRRGALLHDLGKIAIPDIILRKQGPLTDEEWVEMRRHPEYADRVLSSIPYLHPAREIPYCHHEKWDGTGYPCGLKGTEIPLAARIFAVIDVWDALSSDRSYRKKWSQEEALVYLQSQRGVHFDPHALDAFLQLIVNESETSSTQSV